MQHLALERVNGCSFEKSHLRAGNAQVFHLPFPEDRGPEGKFSMRATVLI